MKKIKDGWHTILGFRVHVENGCIDRGILGEDNAQRTAYPYRACRSGGRDNCSGLTVAAFRAGVNRGTITMM